MSNFNVLGTDLFGDPIKPKQGVVADQFIVPPFTILDAKQGDWQERKRAWSTYGIKSEVGREAQTYNTTAWIKDKGLKGGCQNIPNTDDEWTGTSIFDPVLTELSYEWYSPKGGQIVDPFAGGSVRGIVAGMLGRNYWGSELRHEQVEANREQAEEIQPQTKPVWICGDSMNTLSVAPKSDFVFSCPPYGDLEVYSDDPNDLSNMEWHTFVAAYKRIILKAVVNMKDDS